MSKARQLSLAVCATCLLAATAHAHISLDQGATHKSRYGDASIKAGPCGIEGGGRGTHVYTYAPGDTIRVEAVEFITHPGYFRIAFDEDGDDAFLDPRSIPNSPPSGRACSGAGDQCGEADFDNNAAVLQDNLDAHVTSESARPHHTWNVQLPNIECERCTLQIIQVMTDKPPYVPNTNDIYYQCIDLVLKAGVEGAGSSQDAGSGATTGGTAGSSGRGAQGTATDADAGGCSVASSPGSRESAVLWSVSAAAALLALRRRRARVRTRVAHG